MKIDVQNIPQKMITDWVKWSIWYLKQNATIAHYIHIIVLHNIEVNKYMYSRPDSKDATAKLM